jgi:hypothetical protein
VRNKLIWRVPVSSGLCVLYVEVVMCVSRPWKGRVWSGVI